MSQNRPFPVEIASLGKGIKRISRSTHHACAIKGNNELWCWGDGGGFALRNAQATPTRIDLPSVDDVVTGAAGGCAHAVDGHWWCWGSDPGALTTASSVPILVPRLGTDTVQVAISDGQFRCARKRDGSVWCWGLRPSGAVKPGSDDNVVEPTQVGGIDSTVDIASGGGFSCAVKADGSMWCWGTNWRSVDREASSSGALVKVPLASVSRVWAGPNQVCALVAGDLWCMGWNLQGQIGTGTLEWFHPEPFRVLRDVVDVAPGMMSMCARTKDNTLWCWGLNSHGQTGDGTTEGVPCSGPSGAVCRPTPVRVRELCR